MSSTPKPPSNPNDPKSLFWGSGINQNLTVSNTNWLNSNTVSNSWNVQVWWMLVGMADKDGCVEIDECEIARRLGAQQYEISSVITQLKQAGQILKVDTMYGPKYGPKGMPLHRLFSANKGWF